jgi:cytochrome c oxidase subunit I
MVDTTAQENEDSTPAQDGPSFMSGSGGVVSWIVSSDHKRVGFAYLVLALLFAAVSGVLGVAARFTTDGEGTLVSLYAAVAALLVIPSVGSSIGLFVLPLQIGARSTAIPPLNTVGLLLYLLGAGLAFVAGAGAGEGNALLVVAALIVLSLSVMTISINLLLTMHFLRAPTVSWFKVPLFSWGVYTSALAATLATKLVILALVVTAVFPSFGLGAFQSDLGSEALLFQYVNAFGSYPLAFIFAAPVLMLQGDIIAAASGRKPLGYQTNAFSCFAIALIALFGWVISMILPPDGELTHVMLSFVSMGCTIFALAPLINFAVTMFGGALAVRAPVVFSMGFFFLFIAACFGGTMTSALSLGTFLQGSAFEAGQNHLFLTSVGVMGLFSGAYFWWPKMTGQLYNDSLGKIAALITLGGAVVAFLPQLMIGAKGLSYTHALQLSQFDAVQGLSTIGAVILVVGILLSVAVLLMSLTGGEKSSSNPWGAKTLEWTHAATPPAANNFASTPETDVEPYAA